MMRMFGCSGNRGVLDSAAGDPKEWAPQPPMENATALRASRSRYSVPCHGRPRLGPFGRAEVFARIERLVEAGRLPERPRTFAG